MNLPEEFIKLIESYRAPQLAGLGEALLTTPEVSVRINPLKSRRLAASADTRVPWCYEGVYLPERPRFTFSPELHQGVYYVQDASSMFINHVLKSLLDGKGPVRYLDACAAPGGKTTAAISALPAGSTVGANEYVAARAAVLRENLAKWGYPPTTVTCGPVSRFGEQTGAYDVIAADVPCSGEGMMRKEAVAVEQWSPQLVEKCAALQREIVSELWPALAPGGLLIYSTCTFNRTENEEMVAYLVKQFGAESVEVPSAMAFPGIAGGIDTPYHCYRFIPGRTRGEGLFMAVLRKPDDDLPNCEPRRPKKNKARGEKGSKPDMALKSVMEWIEGPAAEGAKCTREGDEIWIEPTVHPLWRGVVPRLHAATVKGKDIIPSQHLALSRMLRREAMRECEVDARTAIDYLSCKAVALPDGTPRGIVLLTYGGEPLGFVKNLGGRANNLYPRQWRILTEGEPEIVDFLQQND